MQVHTGCGYTQTASTHILQIHTYCRYTQTAGTHRLQKKYTYAPAPLPTFRHTCGPTYVQEETVDVQMNFTGMVLVVGSLFVFVSKAARKGIASFALQGEHDVGSCGLKLGRIVKDIINEEL